MARAPLHPPPAEERGDLLPRGWPPPALARVRYRVGQFLRGWRASVSVQDEALVRGALPPPAAALFARMPTDAQAHSVAVLKDLLASGETSPDLAAAALLHDVGKVAADDAGAYLGLWLRGPLVLLEAWQPQRLAAWASPTPSASPRYALHVHLEHPQIGARWAAQAGCSETTCWLIAHHQDKRIGPQTSSSAPPGAQADCLQSASSSAPALSCRGEQTRTPIVSNRPAVQGNDYQRDLARLQWADGRN